MLITIYNIYILISHNMNLYSYFNTTQMLKGSSDAKFTLQVVWSVFTHPSYNDKNPPSVFFLNLF